MNIHGGVSARCFITPSTPDGCSVLRFTLFFADPATSSSTFSSSRAASINMQRHIELCLSSTSRASHVLANVHKDGPPTTRGGGWLLIAMAFGGIVQLRETDPMGLLLSRLSATFAASLPLRIINERFVPYSSRQSRSIL